MRSGFRKGPSRRGKPSPVGVPCKSNLSPCLYVFASQKDEPVETLDRWSKFMKMFTPHVRLVDADSTREETVKWLEQAKASHNLEIVTIRPPHKCPLRFAHDYFVSFISEVKSPSAVFIPVTVHQFPAVRFNRYPATVLRVGAGQRHIRDTHIIPLDSKCQLSSMAIKDIHQHQGTWQARLFRGYPISSRSLLVESDDSKIVIVGQPLLHPSAITDSDFHATTTGAQFGLHPHLIIVEEQSKAIPKPDSSCALVDTQFFK